MSKIVRLGMTESGLLFLNWVYKHVKLNEGEKQIIMRQIMNLTNWLYSTSGYYDKSVKGDKFRQVRNEFQLLQIYRTFGDKRKKL
jgi:hypothetical protein